VLDRLRAIKVEAHGARRPLRVSVGLAAWQDGGGAAELLLQTRAASQAGNGEDAPLVGSAEKAPLPAHDAAAAPAARSFERR
jgi:hypothetical protein